MYTLKKNIYTGAIKAGQTIVVFSKDSFFDAYEYGMKKDNEEPWQLKTWEFDGDNWKLLRTSEINPSFRPQETNPTFENVLDYYNVEFSYGKPFLKKAKEKDFEKGCIVAVAGLSPCPWCASEMKEEGNSFRAVCVKNPLHKVVWVPWGG